MGSSIELFSLWLQGSPLKTRLLEAFSQPGDQNLPRSLTPLCFTDIQSQLTVIVQGLVTVETSRKPVFTFKAFPTIIFRHQYPPSSKFMHIHPCARHGRLPVLSPSPWPYELWPHLHIVPNIPILLPLI